MSKCSYQVLHTQLSKFASGLGMLSGAMFLLLAFMMACETTSRYFGGPFTGFMDQIASFVMALGGTWSLAHALNMKSHVRIDIVSNLFPKALNRYCQILAYFAMGLFATVLTWQTAALAYASYEIGALVPQSMIQLPLALPQALTVVGFSLLAIQAFLFCILALASSDLPDDGQIQEAV